MNRCDKSFNKLVGEFLKIRDIPTTALAQRLEFIVGSSTIRNWTLGQPASPKTAKKFVDALLAVFPDEDASKWLCLFDHSQEVV